MVVRPAASPPRPGTLPADVLSWRATDDTPFAGHLPGPFPASGDRPHTGQPPDLVILPHPV